MIAGADVLLSILAVAIAAGALWIHRRRAGVPQFVAAHVALAGGTASAIAAVGLFRAAAAATTATGLVEMEQAAAEFGFARALLALGGVLIGAMALSGSTVALARLHWNTGGFPFRGQWRLALVLLLLLAAGVLGVMVAVQLDPRLIAGFVVVGLALGIGVALPVAPADLPRVIWSGAAMTGLAWVCTGLALRSPAFAVAGMVVGAIGVLRERMAGAVLSRDSPETWGES